MHGPLPLLVHVRSADGGPADARVAVVPPVRPSVAVVRLGQRSPGRRRTARRATSRRWTGRRGSPATVLAGAAVLTVAALVGGVLPAATSAWTVSVPALLLAVAVVATGLRPVVEGPGVEGPAGRGTGAPPATRPGLLDPAVSATWGFTVALAALGPLGLVLAARCVPQVLRDVRRGAPPRQVAARLGRLALGVLTCRAVLALLVGVPVGGGALVTSPRQWPAVLVAGAAGLLVHTPPLVRALPLVRTLRPARRTLRAPGPASRGAVPRPLPGLAALASAPLLVVSTEGGALLLALVCLAVAARPGGAALTRRRERRAPSDALTGLPDRDALQDSITRALARTPAPVGGSPAPTDGPGLLVVDLDHFKDVNDTLGHPVGDALLRRVAQRLLDLAPADAVVARLGGDEFALLVPDAVAAEPLAAAVVEAMSRPLRVEDLEVLLPASVGVALAPRHGTSGAALLKSADVALYQAKELRGRACTYTGQRDANTVERLRLLGDLRGAVERGELFVQYQPQVDPATGAVVGAEALVRWRHPELGHVPPDRFIPLAERSGLVRAVTEVVLDTAVADLAQWRTGGHLVTVSVNLAARSLDDADLPDLVARTLARHRVAPSALVLEITETGLMADPARAGAVVRRLRALGCSVAVDDFGTGHCSLGHLTDLDVDELKVDRSFVTPMAGDRARAVIVRSTVQLGRDLGLRVVAEGVEDETTQRLLAALGCHVVQGDHVGPPTSAAGVLRRLRGAPAPGRPPVPTPR